jgi:tRNA pseudouridine38-40 synthase
VFRFSLQPEVNIRLLIEYDGTAYCGWQRQLTGPSIQEILEETLRKITGVPTTVYGASRTDSGVHAKGQVALFQTLAPFPAGRWALMLNFYLPSDIRVLESREAAPGFHPQKKAVEKEYEYVVLNRAVHSALYPRVYFMPRNVDWALVRRALPYFVGTHDFKSFQGAKAELKTTVRTITGFDLFDRGDGFFAFRTRGTGFLKQQVRTMVGTLLEVGFGKRSPEDISRVLDACSRREAGPTAPARGLSLVRVYYEGD